MESYNENYSNEYIPAGVPGAAADDYSATPLFIYLYV